MAFSSIFHFFMSKIIVGMDVEIYESQTEREAKLLDPAKGGDAEPPIGQGQRQLSSGTAIVGRASADHTYSDTPKLLNRLSTPMRV